jgi:ribonucleotide reductase class II
MPLTKTFLDRYSQKTPPWGFNGLGYIVYKRTYARITDEDTGATEDWTQTCQRVIDGANEIGAELSNDESERMFDYMFNLKGMPGGRMLWQLGTPNNFRLGLDSLCNCWFVDIKDPSDFAWMFERLMLGGGVGFSILHPQRLGVVRQGNVDNHDVSDADYIVPDKREGWAECLLRSIKTYLGSENDPTEFSYSTQLIRPAGAPIRTFGGTASGPGILVEGITKISAVLNGAVGRNLSSTEVLDICNIIGSVVVAGNVRRSAEIALGSPYDIDFLSAKRWDLGDIPHHRAMSNNSVVTSNISGVPDVFWEGYHGNGEPYGLFNLDASRKYGRRNEIREDKTIEGTNPCVTSDTWILTDKGARQVNDLIGVRFNAIVDGKPYPTLPGTFGANGFWKTGTKEILELTLVDGQRLRLTENHQVMTRNEFNEEEWIPAGELEIGSTVILHDHQDFTWDGQGTQGDGYLVGHVVGDGTFSSQDNGEDIAYAEVWTTDLGSKSVQSKLTSLLSDLKHRSDHRGWRKVSNSDGLRWASRSLAELANSYGISRNRKTITSKIEEASSNFYKGLLQGWFDADGHIEGHSTKGGVSVRLSSIDLISLEAAQRMLARLGIRSSIRLMHHERDYTWPDGNTYHSKESWRLIISGQHALRFMDQIGFSNESKKATWEQRSIDMKRGFYSKPSQSYVADIKTAGTEDVYDVTVDAVHAFDANGLYVHNCAEIGLANRESCNLAEIMLPNIQSQEELIDIAKLLYKIQKAVAALPALDRESDEITSKNMRLGLGITGMAQAIEKLDWLSPAYEALRDFDRQWSTYKEWPTSVRLTTIKPSGTLSLLAGVTPGIHPGYSRHHIRRVRMAASDPLLDYCQKRGYRLEWVHNDSRTKVVEFPCEFPSDTTVAADMSAVDQLELQCKLQELWADNAVSVTVYIKPGELESVQEFLEENWTTMKSVSFLLHNEHGFDQAPLEEITKQQYEEMLLRINNKEVLVGAGLSELLDDDCATGACPIR